MRPSMQSGSKWKSWLDRAIAALGALALIACMPAMPSARDWPVDSAADYYQQYVFALWPSDTANPARDQARTELARRVMALPAGLP